MSDAIPRINHSSDNPSLDTEKKKKKTRSKDSKGEPIAVRQSPDPSKQTKSRETHGTNLSDDNSKKNETITKIISTYTTNGHTHMKNKEYGDAEQHFERACEFSMHFDPKRPETIATCHINLAQCYEKQEKYNEAKQEYKKVLNLKQLDTKSRETAICHQNLAQCYMKLKKYNKAEQPCKDALAIYKQLNPKSREVATWHHNLADCYMMQGKYGEAEQPCKDALAIYKQLDPKSHEVANSHFNLANCYMMQGKYDEARQEYKHGQATYKKLIQQLQRGYDQQKHQEQLANIQQEYQKQLTNVQQKFDQARQEIDSLQRQLQEERSKVQSKGIFSIEWGSKSIKTQQKHDKKWQENQEQLTRAQQELILEKQKNDRLQRQLQKAQKALDQAQPNRQLDTSSRSTDKEEVSTSKPLALIDKSDGERTKPLALIDKSDGERTKPLALIDKSDGERTKPLALIDKHDGERTKPLALSDKDPKPPAQFETKADSASTSVQDVNMPSTIHCALGAYRTTDILSDTTNYIIYLAKKDSSSDNKKSHQELVFKAPQFYLEEDLDRLKNEAKILKMFKDHPNIVSYQDFNECGTPPFLAMDYAQGGTLYDVHDENECLDLELIIYYVKQIATTVDDIHKQKVIHLDLKPANIFLKGEREPLERELLIGDFGCARVVESEPLQLADDEIVGTTEYIAPEYLNGNPTYASDLYSIAAMTYEWISGHCPFESNFSDAEIRKHDIQYQLLNKSPEPLYDKNLGVTPAIDKVILKGLAKDPKDRYRNVTAFAEALELAYSFKSYKIPEMVSSWISPLLDNQRPQVLAATIDKLIDNAYQPGKRVVSGAVQWTGWPQTTNGSSQTTLFQDLGKVKTLLIGTAGYPLCRIVQLYRSAKESVPIHHPKPLPRYSSYFKTMYAATTIQLRSEIYTIREPLGCVVDATQMLLHDQGIYVDDKEVANKLEYNAEKGSYTGKMPDALKKLGSLEYKFTRGTNIEYLKDALNSSYAIVATLKGRDGAGQHVVVVDKIGMDRYGNGPFVYIRDGSYNKPYKVALDVWDEVWTGESITPNIKD
jgi:serine/threonine protein kinase/Tfp pilus assembly protein PilF